MDHMKINMKVKVEIREEDRRNLYCNCQELMRVWDKGEEFYESCREREERENRNLCKL